MEGLDVAGLPAPGLCFYSYPDDLESRSWGNLWSGRCLRMAPKDPRCCRPASRERPAVPLWFFEGPFPIQSRGQPGRSR